jgi:hypothetical protein
LIWCCQTDAVFLDFLQKSIGATTPGFYPNGKLFSKNFLVRLILGLTISISLEFDSTKWSILRGLHLHLIDSGVFRSDRSGKVKATGVDSLNHR